MAPHAPERPDMTTALPFAAVIFDLDGTLVDSERVALEAGRRAFLRFGETVAPGFLEALIGRDRNAVAAALLENYGHLDQPMLVQAIREESIALREAGGLPLKPGAVLLIEEIAALGLPMAVATSSGAQEAERKLSLAGLRAHFAAVIAFDHVENPKPAPDPYLLAAEALGHAPELCLAFEDSDTGAASARAAGMRVVQVPDMLPSDGDHAHHLAASLIEGALAAGLPLRNSPGMPSPKF